MFGISKKLRNAGVLGLNQRNAEYTLWHNPRQLFPLVDDKLTTKTLAQKAGMDVPPLYGIIEIQHQVRKLAAPVGSLPRFCHQTSPGKRRRWDYRDYRSSQ